MKGLCSHILALRVSSPAWCALLILKDIEEVVVGTPASPSTAARLAGSSAIEA